MSDNPENSEDTKPDESTNGQLAASAEPKSENLSYWSTRVQLKRGQGSYLVFLFKRRLYYLMYDSRIRFFMILGWIFLSALIMTVLAYAWGAIAGHENVGGVLAVIGTLGFIISGLIIMMGHNPFPSRRRLYILQKSENDYIELASFNPRNQAEDARDYVKNFVDRQQWAGLNAQIFVRRDGDGEETPFDGDWTNVREVIFLVTTSVAE